MLGRFRSFDRCNPMLRINVGNVRNECGGILEMLVSFDKCILKIGKLGMLISFDRCNLMLRMNVRNECGEC